MATMTEGAPARPEPTAKVEELKESWTTIGGLRIFARVSTSADDPGRVPVVLVHGLGVSSSYFVPTAERLATEFAVYAPDLPGHGRSDTPPEPLDVPRLADALVAWMDAEGLGRVSLVGHSMGCQTVVEVATRYPGRVDRLVLIGPSNDPEGRTAIEHFRRLLVGGVFERPSLLWLLLCDYLRMGSRFFAELRFMLGDRVEEKMPKVSAPALVVGGENDRIAPRRWLEETARLVGAGYFAVIPWWGHAVQYSGARQVVEAIAPFLRADPRAIARDLPRESPRFAPES